MKNEYRKTIRPLKHDVEDILVVPKDILQWMLPLVDYELPPGAGIDSP